MNFFLLSTSHFEDRLWFKDDEDFLAAMNYVAVTAAAIRDVNILAFVLMSNHVHFVLESSEEKALSFLNHFKRLYGAYCGRKYGVRRLLRRNGVDIREVSIHDESLLRAIAYVIANPVAANICLHPVEYKWGSGNAFFNPSKEKGVRLAEVSVRKRRVILRSKIAMNPDWRLGREGFILPESYMAVRFVESLFHSPKRLGYFISNSSKAKARLEKDAVPAFDDQLIMAAAKSLCKTRFRCPSLTDLSDSDFNALLHDLRRRFNSDVSQLARVLGISYEEASRRLDEFLR